MDPHTESTFPRSRQIVDQLMGELTAGERRRLTVDNAQRLYDFTPPPC